MENNDKFICPCANMQPCSSADDEISLLDIWNIIWERRILILALTALVTAAAVAYATLAPKTYETTVTISPPFHLSLEPGAKMLFSKISATTGASVITPAIVVDVAVNNLQNVYVQSQFADNNGIDTQLLRTLKVKRLDKKRGSQSMSVSLSGETPNSIADLLNEYIAFVDGYTGRTVIDGLEMPLNQKKLALEDKIESARHVEKEKIKQRIALLREQKAMAEKLNIIEIPEENLVLMPLYARGAKVLQVEIDSLRQRKNVDSFVASLPVLKEQLRALEKIDLKKVKIATLRADKAPIPIRPVKPEQRLFIALGSILGLMMGVFVAFLMNFVRHCRQLK